MVKYTINVRSSSGNKFNTEIDPTITVLQLKEQLVSLTETPVERQRLIYKGRVLKDDQTLESYGLEDNHTIHFVRGSVPNVNPLPSKSTTNIPESTTAPSSSIPNTSTNNRFTNNTFNPWTGSNMAGNPFSNLGNMQQQMLQNPELMQNMMNTPMMQNILNNPDIMRNMMENNPALQQLMNANPELRHVMSDSSFLRQSMEMMRNPNAMREMMRNQDVMLRNIESHPEGFNALRRNYEELQQPLQNALQQQNSAPSIPFPMPGNIHSTSSNTPTSESANVPPRQQTANNNSATFPFNTPVNMNPDLLANPMFQSMMQTMMSNPTEAMNMMQLMHSNNSNNSNFPMSFTNPSINNPWSTPVGTTNPVGTASANIGSTSTSSNVNLEEIYSTQLNQMREMGFINQSQNIRALQLTMGNVNAAIERILDGSI